MVPLLKDLKLQICDDKLHDAFSHVRTEPYVLARYLKYFDTLLLRIGSAEVRRTFVPK